MPVTNFNTTGLLFLQPPILKAVMNIRPTRSLAINYYLIIHKSNLYSRVEILEVLIVTMAQAQVGETSPEVISKERMWWLVAI